MIRHIELCDEAGQVMFEGVSLLSEPPPPPPVDAAPSSLVRPANDNCGEAPSGLVPILSARSES